MLSALVLLSGCDDSPTFNAKPKPLAVVVPGAASATTTAATKYFTINYVSGSINSVTVDPVTSDAYLAGAFNITDVKTQVNLAKFDKYGNFNSAFAPLATDAPVIKTVFANSKIFSIGSNKLTKCNATATPIALCVQNASDGSLDATYMSYLSKMKFSAGAYFNDIVIDPTGILYGAGVFTGYMDEVGKAQANNNVLSLNKDGTYNLAFQPDFKAILTGPATAVLLYGADILIAQNADGKINFVPTILGFDSKGVMDAAFAKLSHDGSTIQMAAGAKNELYILGSFKNFTDSTGKPLAEPSLVLVDTTKGTLTGFNDTKTLFDVVPTMMSADATGVSVVGAFTKYGGTAAKFGLARINSKGVWDSAFAAQLTTGFDVAPLSIVSGVGNNLMISGAFTTYNGAAFAGVIQLDSTNYNPL